MIFNLYKPRGISSNNFLGWFKKRFNIHKAGFYGTLDPLAQGVLPVFTAEATKLINFLEHKKKTYRFTIKTGWRSESLDAEGPITKSNLPVTIKKNDLQTVLKNCCGTQIQIPPAYSAVKISGTRAYKLAKKYQAVDMSTKAKEVTLFDYKINTVEKDTADISIVCSPGYYVRSIAAHIAKQLKIDGFVTNIYRQDVDNIFNLDNAIYVEQLLTTTELKYLTAIKWQKIFANYLILLLKEELLWKKVCHGQNINISFDSLSTVNSRVLDIGFRIADIANTPQLIFLSYAGEDGVCIGFVKYIPSSNTYNFKPKKLVSHIT